jgi:putative ABC transport system permease protein
VIRYLRLVLAASLRRAPSLYLLTLLGVALGVASVLTIQILNRNALAAFTGSVQAVSGDADLSVLGRTPTIPDSLYPSVLGTPGVAAAWAVYRTDVALADRDTFFLDAVGVDVFAPVTIPFVESEGEGPGRTEAGLAEVLTTPGWTAISPELARVLGLAVGDSLLVTAGTRRLTLRVGALVDFRRITPLAGTRLVVMDIAQAQALFGQDGRLVQVDVRAVPGSDVPALAASLRARLGPIVDVLTPEQREERAEGLLAAFRLNLTALSLISLFVGLFLVYSATQASLVRRRAEFGLLRSLGATPAQVFFLIAAEVALLGAIGTALGLPLGYWIAEANVHVVSATLTNLYLLNAIETLRLPTALYALAAAVGIGGALVGALLPALDMSRRDTKTLLAAFTLHERIGSAARPLFGAGAAILVLAAAWYGALGHAWKPAGFALAVVLLVALPLLTPLVVQRLADVGPVRDFGIGYGLRGLGVRLQTTAFAIAALGVAVSMMVGITLMVGSFRRTLTVWIDSSLRADVYITTPSWRGVGVDATLDSAITATLAGLPGVRAVDRLRGFPGYTGGRRVALAGVEMGIPFGESRFPLLAGSRDSAFAAVHHGAAVLISEPLSRKTGLGVGDSLPLTTARGEQRFAIAGVYYDYSSDAGTVILDLRTLRAAFGPGPVNSIALYLAEGVSAERTVDAIKAALPTVPLLVRSNRRLRQEIFTIFDQTFAITRILQGMALLIAVCGITLTLLVLARERISELALYRALGAGTRQIFGLFVAEGVGMGALGILLGAVGGILLAGILIFVINRSYFGWTIQVAIPTSTLAWQGLTILAAAAAASVYPALRASRTTAAELARDDV